MIYIKAINGVDYKIYANMEILSIIKNFLKEGFLQQSYYSRNVVRILLFKFVFIMGFLLFAYGPHLREKIDDKVISNVFFEKSFQKSKGE